MPSRHRSVSTWRHAQLLKLRHLLPRPQPQPRRQPSMNHNSLSPTRLPSTVRVPTRALGPVATTLRCSRMGMVATTPPAMPWTAAPATVTRPGLTVPTSWLGVAVHSHHRQLCHRLACRSVCGKAMAMVGTALELAATMRSAMASRGWSHLCRPHLSLAVFRRHSHHNCLGAGHRLVPLLNRSFQYPWHPSSASSKRECSTSVVVCVCVCVARRVQ